MRGVDVASIAELNAAFGLNAACLEVVSGSGLNAALQLRRDGIVPANRNAFREFDFPVPEGPGENSPAF